MHPLTTVALGLIVSVVAPNFVTNGDFEDGMSGWWLYSGSVQFIEGPTGTALLVRDKPFEATIAQAIDDEVRVASIQSMSFDAQIVANPAAPLANVVHLGSYNEQGVLFTLMRVSLGGGRVSAMAWTGDYDPSTAVELPTDGDWHHYELVVADSLDGNGLKDATLFVDYEAVAELQGALSADTGGPLVLRVGDISARGVAPDVAYDNVAVRAIGG